MWGSSLLAELTHSSLGEFYGFRGENELLFMGYKPTYDWGPHLEGYLFLEFRLPVGAGGVKNLRSAPECFRILYWLHVVSRYHFHPLHANCQRVDSALNQKWK